MNRTIPSRSPTTALRRGTVLVFVLGVLTLLALVGLVLIARTHGEFQRVTLEGNAANDRSVLDGLVSSIQDTLRQDIWGQDPYALYPLVPPTTTTPGDIREKNEPYDAPGPDDRWLASLVPFNAGTAPGTGAVNAFPPPIGDSTNLVGELNVLAWPYVSYVGVDLLAPAGQKPGASTIPDYGARPFVWAENKRFPAPSPTIPVYYSPDKLQKVCVLQTPPVVFTGALIPGSTTNVTIAKARENWNSSTHQQALARLAEFGPGSPRVPMFPYFDTNEDGILDLYDADGDGIPDSPLSLKIPVTSDDPNSPRELYAAVRIVDHNSMLNVNTASSVRKPGGGQTNITFDETRSTLQRRGQRATELLLDDVVHPDDRDYENVSVDRARGLVNTRNAGLYPDVFDSEVVRTLLLGGKKSTSSVVSLFGLGDENALRHRGTLTPYDRRFDFQALDTDYSNIDRALRKSLQWSRVPSGIGYNPTPSAQWNRLNANYGSPDYEGADAGGLHGWRSLMTEDEPFAIRRQLLTTLSDDVVPMPDLLKNVDLLPNPQLPGETSLDRRIRNLWSLGMDWPVFIAQGSALEAARPPFLANSFTNKFLLPAAQMPPEQFRAQPIDLNMGDVDQPAVKEAMIRYVAAAVFMALESESQYQGIVLPANDPRNREYLAWQFAVNLVDYRDADNEPTAIQWPFNSSPPHYVIGVEKQPFFTEAYAYLKAGNIATGGPGPSSGGPDKWWFAFELYVPPYWTIDAGDLYVRIPRGLSAATVIPLATAFRHRASGNYPSTLSGGTSGQYYVFCGIDANAPDWARGNPASYPTGSGYQDFYQITPQPGITDLQLPTDGTSRIELVQSSATVPEHVIDVIGPQYSGGRLDRDSGGSGFQDGMTTWAARPPGAMSPEKYEYSLSRCTIGWRFTTAWHHFEYGLENPVPGPTSTRPVPKSLGHSNEAFPSNPPANRTYRLYQNIPESVWPGRALVDTTSTPSPMPDPPANPVNGFKPGAPFSCFDSPIDLSKLLLVGPLTQQNISPPVFTQVYANLASTELTFPATAVLASMLQYGDSANPTTSTPPDQPPATNLADRLATGRINFAPYVANLGTAPPAWIGRLFNFFTTQSPLFDGVDNDGNGATDMGLLGGTVADPLEAWGVVHRQAGRINVNTAPASVLRSLPSMSLLPTSAEYLFHQIMGGGANPLPGNYNPYAEYFSGPSPKLFWDMATAIVARRENRSVPLRMWDPSYSPTAPETSQMRTVAIAGTTSSPGPGPASGSSYLKGPFKAVTELQRLLDRSDLSPTGDPYLFRIDRFVASPSLHLPQHRYNTNDPSLGGSESPLSPDFRFRRSVTENNRGYVEFAPTIPTLTTPETGGLRSRDALLSRWANQLTVRSDVFTAYIALIDENGNYIRRSQVTLDRSNTFREAAPTAAKPQRTIILPEVVNRIDTRYSDDTK